MDDSEDSDVSLWKTQRAQRTVCGRPRGLRGQCVEDSEGSEDSV